MANEKPEEKKEEGTLLLALQNRLLNLETKHQDYEKEKGKPYVDQPFLDGKLSEVRAEINELKKSIGEVIAKLTPAKVPEPEKKGGNENAGQPEKSLIEKVFDEFNPLA